MTKRRHTSTKSKGVDHSSLEDHTRVGSKLLPPLAQIPNFHSGSWIGQRIPEVIWAGLLFSNLHRGAVIGKVRELGAYMSQVRGKDFQASDIYLSGLSELPLSIQEDTVELLTTPDDFATALSPLLLFDSLPAKDVWKKHLKGYAPEWGSLAIAVARLLDHQSQESTDCRWATMYCMLIAGRLSFVAGAEESAREIHDYPLYGDPALVRPTIRASEGALAASLQWKSAWQNSFWKECLEKTGCFPLQERNDAAAEPPTSIEKINLAYSQSKNLFMQTMLTSGVDSKHEAVFGFIFYSLGLLAELMRMNASQAVSARLVLRTLLECYINLAYLVKKDDEELWKLYRVFGAGQAKLSYLKLETSNDSPNYVTIDMLKALANEDVWEEFLPIELGHWANSDLRKMSEEAGLKEMYDRYYSWTSSYAHGHWGPIRDAAYEICGNPLHRLHRIPSEHFRLLPNVLPDACAIVDRILHVAGQCYPEIQLRIGSEVSGLDVSADGPE